MTTPPPKVRSPRSCSPPGRGRACARRAPRCCTSCSGRPLVCYPVELRARAGRRSRRGGARPSARGGRGGAARAASARGAVTVVEQTEQRGTGHAVRLAMPALARMDDGLVLVLYGDVPLLRRETLEELVGTARRYGCLALVTATPPDPTGYGRILRDERGHVIGVVEQKDASPEERAHHRDQRRHLLRAGGLLPRGGAGPRHRQRAGRVLPDRRRRARRRSSIGVSAIEADVRRRGRASTIASSSPRPRRRCAAASTAR